ncbi:MAG TPA: glutamate 5-kinase [Acidimicrobiales bacterium]|nr:glutamate 5-kinase [Acidimicrobiales bacterium]
MTRIIVKVGSSSLTGDLGQVNSGMIADLCRQVTDVRERGHQVVLVSSGAVSAGVAALGLSQRPVDQPTLQALAALGQPRLMETWRRSLAERGAVAAQVLMVPHDFVNRRQYLHARQTLVRLLELGCVPVVNENDAVAHGDVRYGDNDRVAALVAHLVSADVLLLLTDLDGLYTADPRREPSAELIGHVAADDPILGVVASGTGSSRGSGGMASKLTAARIASWSGVRAVIARADRPDVVASAVAAGAEIGTTFEANERRLPARKLWIAFASAPAGHLVVDDGARAALVERGTSLLPAGVIEVSGQFDEGDTLDVTDREGAVFARGMAAADAKVLRRTAGRRTSDLPADVAHEAIHRDDLVVLPRA